MTKKTDAGVFRLSACLFWDYDRKKIDCKRDKELIIERALTLGNENDERLLYTMYSAGEIKRAVKKSVNLNGRTAAYLSVVFNIPPEKFKCLKQKPFYLNC
jgi:hypothetical protein